MAKGTGNKIMLRFSEQLIGDVTGTIGGYTAEFEKTPDATVSVSSRWNVLTPESNLLDSNLNSYWSSNLNRTVGEWIKLRLSRPELFTSISLYTQDYAITGCIVSGSMDDVTYIELATATLTTDAGWKDILLSNATKYAFYKITVTSAADSSRVHVFGLRAKYAYGMGAAFAVSGNAYKCAPEGELAQTVMPVQDVALAPAAQIRVEDAVVQLDGVRVVDGVLALERA